VTLVYFTDRDLGLRFPEILKNFQPAAVAGMAWPAAGRSEHSSAYFSSKPNSPIFNVRQFSLTIR
jgi:hypothetical protein